MNSLLNQFTGLKYDLENQLKDLKNSCSCSPDQVKAQNTAAMLRENENSWKTQQQGYFAKHDTHPAWHKIQ